MTVTVRAFARAGRALAGAALLVASAALAMPAAAATMVTDTAAPDLADGTLDAGDTATDGSTVATFSNIIDGAMTTGQAAVDAAGIRVGTCGTCALSFEITFDEAIRIDTYTVGFRNSGTTGGFQLSGSNGTSGLNDLSTTGTFAFDMGTIAVFLPGVAYTLSHTVSGGPGPAYGQIEELGITQVPLPAAGWLLLASLGALGLARGRRAA